MSDGKPTTMKTIVLSVIVGFLCGVGTIHLAIAGDVRENRVRLNNLENQFASEQKRTDERIFKLVDMVESGNNLVRASIEQTTKLVALIDAQNKLINDEHNRHNIKP
jgi:hypothetical protein